VELIVERAAALDVGKDEVVACIRVPDPGGAGRSQRRRRQEVRTYPTFTSSTRQLTCTGSFSSAITWMAANGRRGRLLLEQLGGTARDGQLGLQLRDPTAGGR
jgi:hypothetical protein